MTLIPELLEGSDAAEAIRDRVASILKAEVVSQKALAVAAEKSPAPYDLRIFVERGGIFDVPDDDLRPIVNVWLLDQEVDHPKSSATRSHSVVRIIVDCIGIGRARTDGAGQLTGDAAAALEAQRATRWTRRWLEAAHHHQLDGLDVALNVRWDGVEYQQPPARDDARDAHPKVVGRNRYLVSCVETAPRVQGVRPTGIDLQFTRADSGELLLAWSHDFPTEAP